MMKRIFIIGAVILLILSVNVYGLEAVDNQSDNFGLKILWDRENGKVKLESVKENPISIRTVREASETDKIKITLQFPQIEGLNDKTVQEGINSILRKAAEAARDEGLKNADDIAENPDGYAGSPNKYETYFDYRLKYNQNGLLSVIFMNYQYTGGAHGITVQSSHTFNLKTGEEYKLKDLMQRDADYISFISGIVKNQIDERVKEGLLPDYSITPFKAIKDEQDFYLSNHAVVVYFQQYEYFPYAAGIQKFAVDFSELKDMLKPDFSFLNEESKSPEFSKLPAVEVAENNRFIPEGGISLLKAKELIADYLAKNGTKGDILSSMQLSEITVKEAWENAGVQLYRVNVDYAWLYGVAAIKDGRVLCVLDGMPTKSVFLADLDNDGCYEIYTNAAFGSGIASMEIRGYNIASDTKYSLSMRMEKDLYLFVQDQALWVKEYLPASPPTKEGSGPVSSGRLVLKESGGEKELSVEYPDNAGKNAPFYGSKVAYAAEDGLYCAGVDDGKAALLVGGTGISTPVFSRDGKAVAYTKDGALYAYDFAASKARLLLEGVDSYCPGQNGGFYASSQKAGIVAVNPQTAESSILVPAEEKTSYMHLKPSPDFRYLAYDSVVSGADNQDQGGTWLYDVAAKRARMIIKAQKIEDASMGMLPRVGKWSPDSGKILIWLMPQSASLSADGVGAAIYDMADGKLTELKTRALAYDENVSFADSNTFAMITGGGRMMAEEKSLSQFDLGSSPTAKTLETSGMVPTTPCYSADGKSLAFAASPVAKAGDDYTSQMDAISKRQIYMYTGGKLFPLTQDPVYRSEAPVFVKNSHYIVFARVNADGEKSVWLTGNDGSYEKLLASWKYSDPEDNRAMDFYGRIDWRVMFGVFDDTREVK
ncbi:MAG: DUF4163 domain-containing protein [Clostridiales bacterium]|jgi:Tol biopolymer transport system component|nr:DUF4163 domain-containing protein [Eubacteriales bacterium]MDH7565053.1 DUF4163 domain-containing protein [Clostridiales bacterium]